MKWPSCFVVGRTTWALIWRQISFCLLFLPHETTHTKFNSKTHFVGQTPSNDREMIVETLGYHFRWTSCVEDANNRCFSTWHGFSPNEGWHFIHFFAVVVLTTTWTDKTRGWATEEIFSLQVSSILNNLRTYARFPKLSPLLPLDRQNLGE